MTRTGRDQPPGQVNRTASVQVSILLGKGPTFNFQNISLLRKFTLMIFVAFCISILHPSYIIVLRVADLKGRCWDEVTQGQRQIPDTKD